MTASELRFYVGIHNDAPLPPARKDYTAIGLVVYNPRSPMHSFSDDSGASISHKNRHYSELTGWFWIWKNVRDIKYVGLSHYRRYFLLDPNHELYFKYNQISFGGSDHNLAYLTHPDRSAFAVDILSSGKIVVPKRIYLRESITSHYCRVHIEEDWYLFRETVKSLWPEYSQHLAWFDRADWLHGCNLMIAPRHFLDAYMADLFSVLEAMERTTPFREEPYQCRVPAFIAERFFSFYVYVTGTQTFEVPVAFIRPAVGPPSIGVSQT
jgi:hypothetical protein